MRFRQTSHAQAVLRRLLAARARRQHLKAWRLSQTLQRRPSQLGATLERIRAASRSRSSSSSSTTSRCAPGNSNASLAQAMHESTRLCKSECKAVAFVHPLSLAVGVALYCSATQLLECERCVPAAPGVHEQWERRHAGRMQRLVCRHSWRRGRRGRPCCAKPRAADDARRCVASGERLPQASAKSLRRHASTPPFCGWRKEGWF